MVAEITLSVVDILAIVLSVVSLLITTIGFFASLKFYRDGVDLQKSANDALVKIEEKAQSIQTQVGGMFDKTLDAAIAKRNELSINFEELSDELEKVKLQIVEEATKQVGAAGENERARLRQIVDSKIGAVQEKVETTRESAESVAYLDARNMSVREKIIALLSLEQRPMSQQEIFYRVGSGSTHHNLARRLRDLVAEGSIEKVLTEDSNTTFFKIHGSSKMDEN